MVSRYPGEDAVLGSHEVGNWNTPHPTSVLKLEGSFLPSPHPQVLSPVSRERIARSYATLLMRSVVDSEGQNTSTTSTISMLGLTTRAS